MLPPVEDLEKMPIVMIFEVNGELEVADDLPLRKLHEPVTIQLQAMERSELSPGGQAGASLSNIDMAPDSSTTKSDRSRSKSASKKASSKGSKGSKEKPKPKGKTKGGSKEAVRGPSKSTPRSNPKLGGVTLPTAMSSASSGTQASPAPTPSALGQEQGLVHKTDTIIFVNEVPLRSRASLQLEQGCLGTPLVITEDALDGDRVTVRPRALDRSLVEEKNKSRAEAAWDKNKSVFSAWREETDEMLDKMLDKDLGLFKLSRFLPPQITVEQVKNTVRPHYAGLVTAWRSVCASATHNCFGITSTQFVGLLSQMDVFEFRINPHSASSAASACMTMDKAFSAQVTLRNSSVLVRFQFLQALLRVAWEKYGNSLGYGEPSISAIGRFFNDIKGHLKAFRDDEQEFRKALFQKEMDYVIKASMETLSIAWEHYSAVGKDSNPSTPQRGLTFEGWLELLTDTRAFDERFTRKKASQAFNFGMMWQLDDTKQNRHMQMSFVEFIMAVAAVVYLKEYWYTEEFGELLEEFVEDNVVETLKEKNKMAGGQKSAAGLENIFTEVFRLADEDGSGELDLREFKSLLRDPRVAAQIGDKKHTSKDLVALFKQVDLDDSGALTLHEALEGLQQMRKLEQTQGRSRAFLLKALENADEDGDGAVTMEDVQRVLAKSANQRKLMRLAINEAEVTTVTQNEIQSRGNCIPIPALVNILMRLRKPRATEKWRIVIKMIFEEADKDRSGSLSAVEFRQVVKTAATQEKLDSIGVTTDVLEAFQKTLDLHPEQEVSEKDLIKKFERVFQYQNAGAYKRRIPPMFFENEAGDD
eukprot:TRINITY_DN30374_c0_g1_i1.p1 TRINITY_DN30374_c0_g1~~TRINITY_DN30374_c0_g1_i1.p1  ORF type:complete len:815 (+),score=235.43 TRINITY_DN30374_c0_g1_i1:334-2778(+)